MKLTLEQEFKLKLVENKLRENYDRNKEDIITLFLALQKQNFVLTNNLKNIINLFKMSNLISALDGYSLGSTILHQDYLYHAQPSLLKTAWKGTNGIEAAGDSQATH